MAFSYFKSLIVLNSFYLWITGEYGSNNRKSGQYLLCQIIFQQGSDNSLKNFIAWYSTKGKKDPYNIPFHVIYYQDYYCMQPGEKEILSVDVRPSDAINVANRCKVYKVLRILAPRYLTWKENLCFFFFIKLHGLKFSYAGTHICQ